MINLKAGQLYFLDLDYLKTDPYLFYSCKRTNIYLFKSLNLEEGWIHWYDYLDELTYKVIKKVKIIG